MFFLSSFRGCWVISSFVIFFQIIKFQNISGTNAATWWKKLAADISSLLTFFKAYCSIYSSQKWYWQPMSNWFQSDQKKASFKKWLYNLFFLIRLQQNPKVHVIFNTKGQSYKNNYSRNLRIFLKKARVLSLASFTSLV